MPLETATYISQLNAANPAHTDQLSVDDSHMRLVKSTILSTFANFTATALQSTQAMIDAACNAVVNGSAQAVLALGSAGAPSMSFLGRLTNGLYSPAANQVAIATNGTQAVLVDASQNVSVAGAYQGGSGQLVPLGGGLLWFTNSLPAGNFQWANGQAISRTTYAALFALLGTTWGAGDGSTTFNIPDLRDRVPVGTATMGGAADPGLITQYAGTLATGLGEGQHTLSSGEMPAHTHTQQGSFTSGTESANHTHTTPFFAGNPLNQLGGGGSNNANNLAGTYGNNSNATSATESVAHTHTVTISGATTSAGSGTAHNIVQPGLVCNWIVRIA